MKINQYVYVAINEDLDSWVADSKATLIRVLVDAFGGHCTRRDPTHYVTMEHYQARECIGWTLEWDDGIGDPFKIYIQRKEVLT